jgi:hypothetical protein
LLEPGCVGRRTPELGEFVVQPEQGKGDAGGCEVGVDLTDDWLDWRDVRFSQQLTDPSVDDEQFFLPGGTGSAQHQGDA